MSLLFRLFTESDDERRSAQRDDRAREYGCACLRDRAAAASLHPYGQLRLVRLAVHRHFHGHFALARSVLIVTYDLRFGKIRLFRLAARPDEVGGQAAQIEFSVPF